MRHRRRLLLLLLLPHLVPVGHWPLLEKVEETVHVAKLALPEPKAAGLDGEVLVPDVAAAAEDRGEAEETAVLVRYRQRVWAGVGVPRQLSLEALVNLPSGAPQKLAMLDQLLEGTDKRLNKSGVHLVQIVIIGPLKGERCAQRQVGGVSHAGLLALLDVEVLHHAVENLHRDGQVGDPLGGRAQDDVADVLVLEIRLRLLRADVLEQRVIDVARDERLPGRGILPFLGFGGLGHLTVELLARVIQLVAPRLKLDPLRLLRGQRAALALEVHRVLLVVGVDDPSRDDLAHRNLVLQPVHRAVREVRLCNVAHDAALELHHDVTLGALLAPGRHQPLDRAVHNLTRGQRLARLAREQRELLPGAERLPRHTNLAEGIAKLHPQLPQPRKQPPRTLAVEVLRVRPQVEHREFFPVIRVHGALQRLPPDGRGRALELLKVVIKRVGDDLKGVIVSLGVDPRAVEDVVIDDEEGRRGVFINARTQRAELGDELVAGLERAAAGSSHGGDERPRLSRSQTGDVVELVLLPGVGHRGVDVHAALVDDVDQRALEDAHLLLRGEGVLKRAQVQGPGLATRGERGDNRGAVANVPTEGDRVANLGRVLDEFGAHGGAARGERRDGIVDEVQLNGVNLFRDGSRVILENLADDQRDVLLEVAARVELTGRGGNDADVRAVFDHELEQPVHVRLPPGGSRAELTAGGNVGALQKVHQLAVGVEHGERHGGIAGSPHRGQHPHLHLVVRAELVVVSNVRLPRRERHATPQRLTAKPANLGGGGALESHGSLAGQRGEERRLGAGERVAPQPVPGVGHLRDLLDDVRRLHLVGELLDDDVGERDAELDQSVAVRLEHRAELRSVELARGFTLQALDLGERVERVHRLGSRRRRLRPHASLAADGPAEPRANRGLGGDLRGGDVHKGADDGGDVRVSRLVAHVNLGDSLGAHVGNRLRHPGAAVRPERRAQVPGVGSVGWE
mmetsp:Transcript_13490/g.58978  ORF Transcript_13490/g.58978 Transcript_13490/m.58978 type:complete len:968 (-) Transcript_13490:995-3898(-)